MIAAFHILIIFNENGSDKTRIGSYNKRIESDKTRAGDRGISNYYRLLI